MRIDSTKGISVGAEVSAVSPSCGFKCLLLLRY